MENSWRAWHGITDKGKPSSCLYKNRICCTRVLLSSLDSHGPVSLSASKINVVFTDWRWSYFYSVIYQSWRVRGTRYLDTESIVSRGIWPFCDLNLVFNLFLFATEFKSWLLIRERCWHNQVRQGQAPRSLSWVAFLIDWN